MIISANEKDRVVKALAECREILRKARAYSDDLQDMKLITDYLKVEKALTIMLKESK